VKSVADEVERHNESDVVKDLAAFFEIPQII